MTYRFVDHTADLGIEVVAETLEELFEECLRAQTDCMTRLERVREMECRELALAAPDLPQLLLDYLSEALYLYETEGLALASAKVKVIDVGEAWSLSGTVTGEEFDLSRHGLKTLLKAVTYHQLSVQRRGEGWVARVIFDI